VVTHRAIYRSRGSVGIRRELLRLAVFLHSNEQCSQFTQQTAPPSLIRTFKRGGTLSGKSDSTGLILGPALSGAAVLVLRVRQIIGRTPARHAADWPVSRSHARRVRGISDHSSTHLHRLKTLLTKSTVNCYGTQQADPIGLNSTQFGGLLDSRFGGFQLSDMFHLICPATIRNPWTSASKRCRRSGGRLSATCPRHGAQMAGWTGNESGYGSFTRYR